MRKFLIFNSIIQLMVKIVNKVEAVSKKKKFKNPYGIFKGLTILEKDIKEVTSSWDKVVDELVQSVKPQKRRIHSLTKTKF